MENKSPEPKPRLKRLPKVTRRQFLGGVAGVGGLAALSAIDSHVGVQTTAPVRAEGKSALATNLQKPLEPANPTEVPESAESYPGLRVEESKADILDGEERSKKLESLKEFVAGFFKPGGIGELKTKGWFDEDRVIVTNEVAGDEERIVFKDKEFGAEMGIFIESAGIPESKMFRIFTDSEEPNLKIFKKGLEPLFKDKLEFEIQTITPSDEEFVPVPEIEVMGDVRTHLDEEIDPERDKYIVRMYARVPSHKELNRENGAYVSEISQIALEAGNSIELVTQFERGLPSSENKIV